MPTGNNQDSANPFFSLFEAHSFLYHPLLVKSNIGPTGKTEMGFAGSAFLSECREEKGDFQLKGNT